MKEETVKRIASFEAMASNEIDADSYYEWGYALFLIGRNEEALEKLLLAHEMQPNDHETLNALGEVCISIEDFNRAEQYLSMAVERWAEEPEYYANLGETLLAIGKKEKAAEVLEAGLEYCLPGEEPQERILEALDKCGAAQRDR